MSWKLLGTVEFTDFVVTLRRDNGNFFGYNFDYREIDVENNRATTFVDFHLTGSGDRLATQSLEKLKCESLGD